MTTKTNSWISLLAVYGLAGCGPLIKIGESGPPPPRYSLAALFNTTATAAHTINAPTLVTVEEFEAPAELAKDRIAVRVGAQEVRYTKLGRWTDHPSRMLQQLMTDQLTAHGYAVASQGQTARLSRYRLEGKISQFAIYMDGKMTAIVAYNAFVMPSQDHKIFWQKQFVGKADVASDTAASMATALNIAANQAVIDSCTWMNSFTSQTLR